jgi:hypothetical protein
MGFFSHIDRFWQVITWSAIVAMVGACYWLTVTNATPDMPFQTWLMNASRDDVWRFFFGCVISGVVLGRVLTPGSRSK